jgi:hypothetical protein
MTFGENRLGDLVERRGVDYTKASIEFIAEESKFFLISPKKQ